jgi:hypothetical protein
VSLLPDIPAGCPGSVAAYSGGKLRYSFLRADESPESWIAKLEGCGVDETTVDAFRPTVKLKSERVQLVELGTKHARPLKLRDSLRKRRVWMVGDRLQLPFARLEPALEESRPGISLVAKLAKLRLCGRVAADDLSHPVDECGVGQLG